MPSILNLTELKSIQNLLVDIKFWERSIFTPIPFIEISARDLISQITYNESTENFMENHALAIELLLNVIDAKLETDDASIHLIVLP